MNRKNIKLVFLGLIMMILILTGCGVDTSYSVEGFELKDDIYQCNYSNDTEQVDISNVIKCAYSKANIKYYEDEECSKEISSIINLVEGDNLVYCTITFGPRAKVILLVTLNCYRLKLFTVQFETNCSTKIEEQIIEEGSLVTKPDVELTKKGYKFKEWNYNFKKPITSDLIIEAKWVANGYTITYDPNGGEIEMGNAVVTYGEPYELDKPTREGYTFLGWEYNGKLISGEKWMIDQDITVTAKWEQDTITSEIEYIIVGATGANLQWTYTNKETVVLRTPYKNGYRFVGWYTDGKFKSDRVYEIPYGTTGHITLYSKWEKFTLAGSKIAFLGDSITTFYKEGSEVNSAYGGENQFYYPLYSSTVKSVTNTWWYKVVEATKTNLLTNDSISGSCCYNWGNENSSSAAMNYTRINNLAGADVVVVFIGTNDNVNGFTTNQFSKAYDTMLKRIKEKCPDAYVFCCTLGYSAYTGYSYTEAKRVKFNEIINQLAYDNDVTTIDFSSVQTKDNYASLLGDNLHPNATGMLAYANKAIETIKNYVGA